MNQNKSKMKTRFTLTIFCLFFLVNISVAQESESTTDQISSPLEISGSADIYYTYDFAGQDNIPTSFADNRNTLAIGMLDVALSKTFKKASFVGEFSFGPRSFKSIPTFDPDGDGQGSNIWLQNLYLSYAFTDKLSVTAGYMGTFVGYEVISPAGNFNYSTSYLFTSGPFQNAGIKLDYAFTDRFAIMVGLFNDWNVYTDSNGMSDIGAQIFVVPVEGWDVYLNLVSGFTSGTIFDITTGWQITEAFYLGLNAADYTYASKNDGGYSGVALYPQLAFNDFFSLGLRGEFFSVKEATDESGAVVSESGSVFSTTLSANVSVGGFTFIPEFRLDSSDDLGFLNKDNTATSGASQVTLAAVYAF